MTLLVWPWGIHSFSLQSPEALVFLVVLPILAAAYVWMQFRRRRYAVRYASVSLVREAVGKGPGVRRHIPAIVYLFALTAMIVGLARPEGVVSTSSQRGIVVLAIDVSGSMLAEDVTPNRMDATKKAARDFVNKQPSGVQVGIVSFSDFGALVQPPTTDKKAATKAIDRLQPERGTNIGGGLEVALDSVYEALDLAPPLPNGNQNQNQLPRSAPTPTPTPIPSPPQGQSGPIPASIVLVSDGQSNTGPPPLRVADEAKGAGIKVYTVGIGTAEGTVLRIQGRSVFTRLDEDTLRGIADATGAHYYNAQDSNQLNKVYDELARQRQSEPKQTELTYYLTGTALLASIIAGAFSLFWFNRLP